MTIDNFGSKKQSLPNMNGQNSSINKNIPLLKDRTNNSTMNLNPTQILKPK